METMTEGGAAADMIEPRLIKRYANRKLYDTRDSRYVTLQQIAELVRDGEDVKIIDNKSKEDLTNVTLAQIIYEEEKKGDSDVKRSTLLSFIQDGQKRLIDSLPAGLSKLVRAEGKLEELDEEVAEAGDERTEKKPGKGAFESIGELRGLADDRVRAILGGAMGHVQQLQGEVRRLQGRIEELEQKLSTLLKIKGSEKPESPKSEPPEA